MLIDPSEVKCELSDRINDELLATIYGIEACKFEGYRTIYNLIFEIDLLEANKNCNKQITC